jgi:HSP20 family protein
LSLKIFYSVKLTVKKIEFSSGIDFEWIIEIKNTKSYNMTFVKQPTQVNNLFEELFNNFPTNWGRDYAQQVGHPKVNIHETADGFHLELIAAGRHKEDFKVNVEKDLLTISFEKKEPEENKDFKTIRKEFTLNSFKRSFSLDEKIQSDAIQAKYENGILKLYLPKKEQTTQAPKEITIL